MVDQDKPEWAAISKQQKLLQKTMEEIVESVQEKPDLNLLSQNIPKIKLKEERGSRRVQELEPQRERESKWRRRVFGSLIGRSPAISPEVGRRWDNNNMILSSPLYSNLLNRRERRRRREKKSILVNSSYL